MQYIKFYSFTLKKGGGGLFGLNKNARHSVLFMLIVFTAFFSGCIRYIDMEDNWPWEKEIFLPIEEGKILGSANTTSQDSLLCSEKAQAMAFDKLKMILSHSLSSFMKETRNKPEYDSLRVKLETLAHSAEVYSLKDVTYMPGINFAEDDVFHCQSIARVEVSKIYDIIVRESLISPGLYDNVQKLIIYQELQSQALEGEK